MSNTDLIRHLRAEHSKHYDALGDLLFDAARALETAESERTYFDEDTLRKVYDALDTTSMTNAEIENAINAMQNAGILFRERIPESADSVQGDAKLRENSGDADATENHNEQEQMSVTWRRDGREWPFIVWEGDRKGSASGRSYRRRWHAILAAWWASRYAEQDVWIEHRLPRIVSAQGSADPSLAERQEAARALRDLGREIEDQDTEGRES